MQKTLEQKVCEINLNIPNEFLLEEKQDSIDFSLLEGKNLVGLMGYSKCGKDTVSEVLSDKYGYYKIKFADSMKKMLDENFKEIVFQDLKNKGEYIEFNQIDFFVEEDRIIKEKLRPYMIWFAETLRKENGVHFWTNIALKNIGEDINKIVVADIRRSDELDFFRGNFNSLKKEWTSYSRARMLDKDRLKNFTERENIVKKYSTNLFLVNQYNLDDEDSLTKDTILKAIHEWLIDGEIFIDSRISDDGEQRDIFIENSVSAFASQYKL